MSTTLNGTRLTENEFGKSFKPFKKNKVSGADGLDVNIITSAYEFIKTLLLKIFNETLTLGIFPENMKISKVTPIVKSGRKKLLLIKGTSYTPIPVLSCFSKILERIMYNRL